MILISLLYFEIIIKTYSNVEKYNFKVFLTILSRYWVGYHHLSSNFMNIIFIGSIRNNVLFHHTLVHLLNSLSNLKTKGIIDIRGVEIWMIQKGIKWHIYYSYCMKKCMSPVPVLLSRFYPDFIQILSRIFRNWLSPDFI